MNEKLKMEFTTKSTRGLLVTVLLLGGCASTTSKPTDTDTQAFADRLIADKVALAAKAQQDYVALVNEDKLIIQKKQSSLETDEIDVDYIGKPQELLQMFAHRYGYRYIETGSRVDLRTINVRVAKAPPIEVLRNIGYQIDASANVELDKNSKTLRLIYKPATANKG